MNPLDAIRQEMAELGEQIEKRVEAKLLRQTIKIAIARLVIIEPGVNWSEVLEALDR